MRVVEEFTSLQGEGKYIGVPSYFIRTTGCNLRCAWKNPDGSITKCDTPYTSWKPEAGKDFNIKEFIQQYEKNYIQHIVITGGEPTLQPDLSKIIAELQRHHSKITIETNGTTFVPTIKKCLISISPKLLSSYAATGRELNLHKNNNKFMDSIRHWMSSDNDYQIKFVYNKPEDLDEILRIQQVLMIPSNKIYIMPQGITPEQFAIKQQEMFQVCIKYNFNYAPRLHIDIFGNKRGI